MRFLTNVCGMMQVPVLYDKQSKTIVSNESADIIRMFATECQVSSVLSDAPNDASACMFVAVVMTTMSPLHVCTPSYVTLWPISLQPQNAMFNKTA